jgi:hypothetical protein
MVCPSQQTAASVSPPLNRFPETLVTRHFTNVTGTNLIATVPGSMARLEASNPFVRIVKTPAVLGTFK